MSGESASTATTETKKKAGSAPGLCPVPMPVVAASEREEDVDDLLSVAGLLHVGQLAAAAV